MEMNIEQNSNSSENVNILLKFIQEAKEGKFTCEIPNVANVTYQRIEIQEQNEESSDQQNEVILFGVS